MISSPLQLSKIIYEQAVEEAVLLTCSYEGTFQHLDAILTQARDSKVKLVVDRLLSIMKQEVINILFLFYDKDIYEELKAYYPGRFNLTVIEDAKHLTHTQSNFDLLFTGSNWCDPEGLEHILPFVERNERAGVTSVWLWDNHHAFADSLKLSALFDLVVPIHENKVNYLKSVNGLVTSAIPAACYQWSIPEAERFFYQFLDCERSDALYGGFGSYEQSSRNILIRECISKIPNNKLFLQDPGCPNPYFALGGIEAQFKDWSNHKVSLSASINTDIPIRIFDALVAGQIPLVASNLNGFDFFISPEAQLTLPLIRFHRPHVEEVERAYSKALALFHRAGRRGMIERHKYAIENHMMCHRILRWFKILEST